MLFALGAVSSAVAAFQSLTSSASSPAKAGFSRSATAPFDPTGGAAAIPPGAMAAPGSGSGTCVAPATMSALLAAQGRSTDAPATSPSSALQHLFSQIDGNGDGRIGKSEFESALGAGGTNLAQAADVFGKLDANGDGSVSLDEVASTLKGAGDHEHHHAHHAGGGTRSGADVLLQALDGAAGTSATDSDGSTTTSPTDADGSIVTLTTPAPRTSASSASFSYNFIEQRIRREAQAISASATRPLSVSV